MIGLGVSVNDKAIGIGLILVGLVITIAIYFSKSEHEIVVSMPGLDFEVYKTTELKSAVDVYQKIIHAMSAD